MTKRRRIIILLACGMLAVVLYAVLFHNREPSYQGRSLSTWLREADPDAHGGPGEDKAVEAVRRIGTNALPFLVRWSSYEQARWQYQFAAAIDKCPAFISRSTAARWLTGKEASKRAWLAGWGFRVLGPDASPVIPVLVKRMTNETTDILRTMSLGELLAEMGPTALPCMLNMLTNSRNPAHRAAAARSLGMQGTNAAPAIAPLLKCMDEPSELLAGFAADALGSIGQEPDKVIPALTAHLQDSRTHVRSCAALALSTFGPVARSAVPSLLRMLREDPMGPSSWAKDALRAIAPESLTNTPPP